MIAYLCASSARIQSQREREREREREDPARISRFRVFMYRFQSANACVRAHILMCMLRRLSGTGATTAEAAAASPPLRANIARVCARARAYAQNKEEETAFWKARDATWPVCDLMQSFGRCVNGEMHVRMVCKLYILRFAWRAPCSICVHAVHGRAGLYHGTNIVRVKRRRQRTARQAHGETRYEVQ